MQQGSSKTWLAELVLSEPTSCREAGSGHGHKMIRHQQRPTLSSGPVQGVWVLATIKGSAAEKAGVHQGDQVRPVWSSGAVPDHAAAILLSQELHVKQVQSGMLVQLHGAVSAWDSARLELGCRGPQHQGGFGLTSGG